MRKKGPPLMKLSQTALVAFALLAACAPATPTALPTTAPLATAAPKATSAPIRNQPLVATVKAGAWSGAGGDNFSISFMVGEGGNALINGIQVTYHATCGTRASNVTETVGVTETVALTSGAFTYTNANYVITGNAVAADRIEGTLKAEGVSLGKLGQCSASGIVWSASPQ